MKLNEKLIKLRKENGLSQEEFGNKINVSRQAVSKWENGETKPDTDKVQEIGKLFNLSFDYLLNDEIEEPEVFKKNINTKKSKLKILLKIFLIIFSIYFLICLYKFIGLYKFYLIADSFSEENYWIVDDFKSSNNFDKQAFNSREDITKNGNIIIRKSYRYENDQPVAINSEGYALPSSIEFKDLDKKISYSLDYDTETEKYYYTNLVKNTSFDNVNIIKETTLSYIPSEFKSIFLYSINPMYFVSIANREIIYNDFIHQIRVAITLNNDYLIESVKMNSNYDGSFASSFSYDYVPGHFTEDRITNPLEEYKDMIIYEE